MLPDTEHGGVFKEYVAGLSLNKLLLWLFILTVAIEAVSILLRFGFNLQAEEITSFVSYFTYGLRLHHGYFGAIILIVPYFLLKTTYIRNLLIIAGGALLLSDLVYHFLVVWPVTGSPEFYFIYPQ